MDRTEDMTIDELAQKVGMTARNVRAYQSRELIPPPSLRGRTGYYGPEHVTRLELIRDLQAEGFNLEAIKRVLSRAPGESLSEVLDFTRAVSAAFGDEAVELADTPALVERWGDQLTPEVVRKVEKLGFVRSVGDDLWEIRSPRLFSAAEELTNQGVPLATAVEISAKLKRHAEAVSKAYVELFLDHVWQPFSEAGEPPDEFPNVRESLERLRPLAGESLLAVFQLAMNDAVEHALEEVVNRMSDDTGSEHGRGSRQRAGRARTGKRRARR